MRRITKFFITAFILGIYSTSAHAVRCYVEIGGTNNAIANFPAINPQFDTSIVQEQFYTLKTSCARFLGVLGDWDSGRYGKVCLTLDEGTGGSISGQRALQRIDPGALNSEKIPFSITVNSGNWSWPNFGADISSALKYNYRINRQYWSFNSNYNQWSAYYPDKTLKVNVNYPNGLNLTPGNYESKIDGTVYAFASFFSADSLVNNCLGYNRDNPSFDITVKVKVNPKCEIVVHPQPQPATLSEYAIDFGEVTATDINLQGQTQFSVACTKTTPYYIGLRPSNGDLNGAGNMKSKDNVATNTDLVPYQLRSTAGINGKIWGNTATSTSVGNGVDGTGTGSAQPYTIYATVPSANYTPDTYWDKVRVFVRY